MGRKSILPTILTPAFCGVKAISRPFGRTPSESYARRQMARENRAADSGSAGSGNSIGPDGKTSNDAPEYQESNRRKLLLELVLRLARISYQGIVTRSVSKGRSASCPILQFRHESTQGRVEGRR